MNPSTVSASLRRRNQRIATYQQLVRPVAVHYARCCPEPLDDLIQVGMLGLLRAAELYSDRSATPFEAFARPHVRGAILHYLRDLAPVLRLPRRLGERQLQLRRTRQALVQRHGREPGAEELRQAMHLSSAQWLQLEQACSAGRLVPLDSVVDGLQQPARESVDEPAPEQVVGALAGLDPHLQAVVRRVVLEGRSYRNAASELGISPMTVQRRLHRGLALLREALSRPMWERRRAPSVAAAC